EGGVRAEIGFVEGNLDIAVFRGEPPGDLSAAIGGGIVDDEDAQIADSLAQHAFDALAQKASLLKAGDGDIDARHAFLPCCVVAPALTKRSCRCPARPNRRRPPAPRGQETGCRTAPRPRLPRP